MSDDLISRQAAIDAIPQRIKGLGGESWMMTYRRNGYNDCVDACLDAIRNLPSVQSEIIRCKDCKHARMTYDGECKYCDVWFPDEAEYLDGDYYCASAERKES